MGLLRIHWPVVFSHDQIPESIGVRKPFFLNLHVEVIFGSNRDAYKAAVLVRLGGYDGDPISQAMRCAIDGETL